MPPPETAVGILAEMAGRDGAAVERQPRNIEPRQRHAGALMRAGAEGELDVAAPRAAVRPPEGPQHETARVELEVGLDFFLDVDVLGVELVLLGFLRVCQPEVP